MWLQALLFLAPLLLLLVVLLPLLFFLLPRVPGSRNPFATDTRRPPAPLVTDKAVRRTVVKTGTGPPGASTHPAGLNPGVASTAQGFFARQDSISTCDSIH